MIDPGQRPRDEEVAAERVRVGDHERALGAGDLDDPLAEQRRVGAVQALRLTALLELQEHRDGRGDLDRELLAGLGPDLHLAGLRPLQPEGRDGGDRSEDVDQRGHVVRAHVQQRPAAACVEERRVRVEDLRPLPLQRRLGEQRTPDVAAGDRALRGLHAGAEHGVRSDADTQARGIRLLQQSERRLAVDADGLLAPHVLAGRDDRLRHRDVRRRDREVDDDLDVGMVEHDVDAAAGRHAVLGGLLAGAVLEQIADGEHAQIGERREVLQVLVADVARADDADADRLSRHQRAARSSRKTRLASMASKMSPS